MHFDGDVRQRGNPAEARLIGCGLDRTIRHHRHDEPEVPRPQPPEMQIADAVTADLQRLADAPRQLAVRLHVQKHRTGAPQQTERPAQDHRDAH